MDAAEAQLSDKSIHWHITRCHCSVPTFENGQNQELQLPNYWLTLWVICRQWNSTHTHEEIWYTECHDLYAAGELASVPLVRWAAHGGPTARSPALWNCVDSRLCPARDHRIIMTQTCAAWWGNDMYWQRLYEGKKQRATGNNQAEEKGCINKKAR